MQNASHDIVRGHQVFSVEGVYDTLFGVAKLAVAVYARQHKQAKTVRVDGR
jgi:hypothetical protein